MKTLFCYLSITFYFLLFPLLGWSQKIDNLAAFRNSGKSSYFRFHYDNDYFTATDKYYTQGYQFEFVNSSLRKNPLTRLLPQFKNSPTQYGLAFEHYGFTPTSIQSDVILVGDRPFAACILLKTFKMSVDTTHHQRLSASLSIGGVGPVAFGGEMQTAIHKWINGIKPQGWQHQIHNDLILNYELNYEKQLLAYRSVFLLNSNSQIKVGTLQNQIQVGFTLMAGRFQSPFEGNTKHKRFQLYGYMQPLLGFVGYNATLQGGLFNRSSPYTIASKDISRMVFQNNFGLILRFKKMEFEYSQSFISKEFKTGTNHAWGGIRIAVLL